MSKPQNPLNYYRTYSYHHILVACNSTETAEELASESSITAFESDGFLPGIEIKPNTLGEGQYVVMINGMSDSIFSIKSAKWSSVLFPDETTAEESTHFRTLATDGEIEIIEPLGVNFLNLLNKVTIALGTDTNGVIFVLKTIFVGHMDNGTVDYIANITGIPFMMYDITALFEVTGAEYIMSFVGLANGAARMPHVSAVADGFSFTCPAELDNKPSTLQGAMEVLQKDINDYYAEQKEKLKREAICSGLSEDFFTEGFIDVKYVIDELPSRYQNLKVGTADPAAKHDKGDGDVHIQKGSVISVEGIIDLIMNSSKQVHDQDQADIKDRHQFKITSYLDISPEKYEVHYQVQDFKATIVEQKNLFTAAPENGQGIEFDYIFTGQNVDVVTFDLKMQYAMTFLQTLSTNASIASSPKDLISHTSTSAITPGTGNKEGPGDQKTEADVAVDGTKEKKVRRKPLFLGMAMPDSHIRNKRHPGTAGNYKEQFQRHAAYENLEARLVIRGNPQLLEETTLTTSRLRNTGTIAQVISEPDGIAPAPDEKTRSICRDVHKIPAYVKVNVFMPTAYGLDGGNPNEEDSGDYAEPFWYTGYYFIIGMNHVFSDGEFTQEIEMVSQPVDAGQQDLSVSSEVAACIKDGEIPDRTARSETGQTTEDPIAKAIAHFRGKIADIDRAIKHEFSILGTPEFTGGPDDPASIQAADQKRVAAIGELQKLRNKYQGFIDEYLGRQRKQSRPPIVTGSEEETITNQAKRYSKATLAAAEEINRVADENVIQSDEDLI